MNDFLIQSGIDSCTGVPTRPLLRWYGGKWRISDWLISLMPPHVNYVEPFSGAASVLMRKPRSRIEVLNDRYDRIVNLFRVLRDPAASAQLHELLSLTPYAFAEYIAARERSDDPIEDARRMMVLGAQSHGATGASGGKLSGWRRASRRDHRNESGRGNSYAKEWVNLRDQVPLWVGRLQGVYIECDDAQAVIKRWDGDRTLIYIDPPYPHAARSDARNAYRHEMSDQDHCALADTLKFCKSMVMISGYRCGLYDELYAGWQRYDCETRADSNARRIESVWLNAAAVAAQPQSGLFG